MNKGYVPRRTPAAHQVAASLSKSFSGYSLYVEGLSDSSFWNNFVHPDNVKVKACNGWKEVVETVQRNIAAGIDELKENGYLEIIRINTNGKFSVIYKLLK